MSVLLVTLTDIENGELEVRMESPDRQLEPGDIDSLAYKLGVALIAALGKDAIEIEAVNPVNSHCVQSEMLH